MKSIFKYLVCLSVASLVACSEDSGSDSSESSVTGGAALAPGQCSFQYAYLDNTCENFVLNEADSTFSFTISFNYGKCSGADSTQLAWNIAAVTDEMTYRYSIHGDTLYTKLVKDNVTTADASLASNLEEVSDGDSLFEVTVYVSRSHQGIRGTWKYVTGYHESPNIYVNPYMDNEMRFLTVGDGWLQEETLPNSKYTFAKSVLVEKILLDIYNSNPSLYYASVSNAGYSSDLYPYSNLAVDIQLVSEGTDQVSFKVNGKDVVFSNILMEMDYFNRENVQFDLTYNGAKCSYNIGYERISEQTCKSELASQLELERDYDYSNDSLIGVSAYYYESGNDYDTFYDCFVSMISGSL